MKVIRSIRDFFSPDSTNLAAIYMRQNPMIFVVALVALVIGTATALLPTSIIPEAAVVNDFLSEPFVNQFVWPSFLGAGGWLVFLGIIHRRPKEEVVGLILLATAYLFYFAALLDEEGVRVAVLGIATIGAVLVGLLLRIYSILLQGKDERNRND